MLVAKVRSLTRSAADSRWKWKKKRRLSPVHVTWPRRFVCRAEMKGRPFGNELVLQLSRMPSRPTTPLVQPVCDQAGLVIMYPAQRTVAACVTCRRRSVVGDFQERLDGCDNGNDEMMKASLFTGVSGGSHLVCQWREAMKCPYGWEFRVETQICNILRLLCHILTIVREYWIHVRTSVGCPTETLELRGGAPSQPTPWLLARRDLSRCRCFYLWHRLRMQPSTINSSDDDTLTYVSRNKCRQGIVPKSPRKIIWKQGDLIPNIQFPEVTSKFVFEFWVHTSENLDLFRQSINKEGILDIGGGLTPCVNPTLPSWSIIIVLVSSSALEPTCNGICLPTVYMDQPLMC